MLRVISTSKVLLLCLLPCDGLVAWAQEHITASTVIVRSYMRRLQN